MEFKVWLEEEDEFAAPDEAEMQKILRTPTRVVNPPDLQGDRYRFLFPLGRMEDFVVLYGSRVGHSAPVGSLNAKLRELMAKKEYQRMYQTVQMVLGSSLRRQIDRKMNEISDPDDIYDENTYTIIYVPASDNIYVEEYPMPHHEMLGRKDIFADVFPDGRWTTSEQPNRDRAAREGRGILARIRTEKGVPPFIAFWPHKTINLKEVMPKFLAKMNKLFPEIGKYLDKVRLALPGQARFEKASDYFSVEAPPEGEINYKPQLDKAKEYLIGDRKVSTSDLQRMRAMVHTNGTIDPILCHPDLVKYPELKGYRPSNCEPSLGQTSTPERWRDAGRKVNLPYLYTHEASDFKSWLGGLSN